MDNSSRALLIEKFKKYTDFLEDEKIEINGIVISDKETLVNFFDSKGFKISKSSISQHRKLDPTKYPYANRHKEMIRILEPEIEKLGYIWDGSELVERSEKLPNTDEANINEKILGLCGVWIGYYWSESQKGIEIYALEIRNLDDVTIQTYKSTYKGIIRIIFHGKFYIEATSKREGRMGFYVGNVGPSIDLTSIKAVELAYINSGSNHITSGKMVIMRTDEHFDDIVKKIEAHQFEGNLKFVNALIEEQQQFVVEVFDNRKLSKVDNNK